MITPRQEYGQSCSISCPDSISSREFRLCGWNVRFIDLSKEHQDWLIHEAEGK